MSRMMNFDDEAHKLFSRLNLPVPSPGAAVSSNSRYNPLDAIFQQIDCRDNDLENDVEVEEDLSSLSPEEQRMQAVLPYKKKGNNKQIFVGNIGAASGEEILQKNNIRYVVNCTYGQSKIPDFFSKKKIDGKQIHYFEFPIGHWSLMVGPSDDDLLDFVKDLFVFVERAWSKKSNVLVHCLAGAHRAGTTGCLLLMKYANLSPNEAIPLAKSIRPVIDPIGTLPEILNRYDRARRAKLASIASIDS